MDPRAGNRQIYDRSLDFFALLLGCLSSACGESSSAPSASTLSTTSAVTSTTQLAPPPSTFDSAPTTNTNHTSSLAPSSASSGSEEPVVTTQPSVTWTDHTSTLAGSVQPVGTTTLAVSSSTSDAQTTQLTSSSDALWTEAEASSAQTDAGSSAPRPARVLLYHFSTLDIPTLPQQLSILTDALTAWGYDVEASEDPAVFSDQNLANYAAVGMINTCFDPFGADSDGSVEATVLQKFLVAGGGLFGLHCADVTFQSVDPPALYNQLLGGRASRNNFEGTSQCRPVAAHPTTEGLPVTFTYTGNLDGTSFLAPDTKVLVNCKWENGSGQDVAVSWVRTEGLGRVFFSNFAKVDADLVDATIGEPHLLAGLAWVLSTK